RPRQRGPSSFNYWRGARRFFSFLIVPQGVGTDGSPIESRKPPCKSSRAFPAPPTPRQKALTYTRRCQRGMSVEEGIVIPTPESDEGRPSFEGRAVRVLLLEDDPPSASLFCRYLREAHGPASNVVVA